MKILMITPDSQMIDRRILLEARSLVNAGHSVTLLAGFECKKEENYVDDGIEIHRYIYDWDDENLKKIRALLPNSDKLKQFVNRFYMSMARRFFTISPFDRYILTKALEFDFDILHVHDFPVLKIGYYIAREKNVKLIYDAHELYHAQDVLPKKLQLEYEKTENEYIKKADVVITVNRFIADIMSKSYKIDTPKVIWNATSFPKTFSYENNKNRLREKTNLASSDNIVLYQGWISPERNIESIVKAVKYFDKGTYLVIIGYGEFEQELKRILKEEKTEKYVYFMGEIPSDEMLTYTVGADLGVIPYLPIDLNHKYCSPNKFFEYMLSKVPVLTHKLAFFEDMNSMYNSVTTCDMESPKDIANSINLFFKDSKSSQKFEDIMQTASKELSWEKEEKKLLKIYDELEKTR